ncbi:T9SS type A sorting domain-containing protein [Pedobacter xixiisoli]|uniref:Por secretion system C-terminal sorting domain-containing protein n=1 Tax=Pedobacter xixiisoli TaxID=1476464 RepID=A0A286AEA6_9SPHI|nr:T9SS type A sorting domain-containing protein [Pedobacter xixiisoli]SOD20236.1 Por secretion system C-terminal sorting domain-containing protein [Pedobacter xixiisoli]
MKKILLTIFAMSLALLSHAQLVGGTVYPINGTDNVSPRTFATLRSAVTYVNSAGLSGSGQAILEFSAGYTNEAMPSAIVINALSGASASLGLTIRPATGRSVSLTGNLAGQPLIDLNNADYITLDGRPGGVGTASAITLENTNTSSTNETSVVRLINDAQFNKLSYITFKSAIAEGIACGAVFLSNSVSGTTGNTDNTINNSTFTYPSTYVAGTASGKQVMTRSTTARPNNNISILNNNFEYWGGNGAVYSTSDGWRVNNNHFYSTQPLSVSGSTSLIAINLSTSNNNTVDGNFIGGQTANAGGAKMNVTALNTRFISVEGNVTSSKTVIQNNTIANISVSSPTDNTLSELRAIYAFGSQAVDVLNNTIGSVSTANSLVMNKNATANSNYYMIQLGNTGVVASNISNNTLANLQFNELSGTGINNFYGIYTISGSGGQMLDNNTITKIATIGSINDVRLIQSSVLSEITNNKIGSQSSTGDLVIESTRAATFYGIRAEGNFASKITGNQIGGISKKTTLGTSGDGGLFNNIYVAGSTTVATLKTVENNLVGGTVANSLQTIPGGGAGIAQIDVVGITNAGGICRNNTVRNMTANETGFVLGLQLSDSVNGVVENNSIENMTLNGQASNSYIGGIYANNISANTINNTISGLKSSNAVTLAVANHKHVMGIFSSGTGIVSGNKISNLEATGAGATSVYGMVTYRTNVLKNRIYDVKSSNATAGASIGGIALSTLSTAGFNIANNVINVNHSGDVPVYGIIVESTGTNAITASYNTILLEGTASGSANSAAFYRTNNSPLDLKNNLFFNNRSGGSGIHSLYGATTTAPAWASDYNFLATAAGNTNVGNWNGTAQNFAAWKAGHSGQDVNSVNDMAQTPSAFFNLASASTDFLRTTASGKLKVGNLATPNSVTDDILGTARAATPTIGAFEEDVPSPLAGGTVYRINGTDGGSGASRTFATLRSAATYANTYGLTGTGQAVLEFSTGYTNEAMPSAITFNALANASATLGLTIRPAMGMSVSLTGNLSGAIPLIDFNNADYITLDGRPGGTGTTSAFSLENTITGSGAQISVIRLINDAQFNKLTYLTIKSALGLQTAAAAVALVETNSGITGNTDNIISYNTFAAASTYVAGVTQGIQIVTYALSAGIPSHRTNILNNKFEHWGGSGAIYSTSGNNWQINNNHFYNTQIAKGNGPNRSGAIDLSNSDGHTIDGNFFGGQAANAGGSKLDIEAYYWNFIYVNGASTAAKTTIQNNTFANINANTPSGSSGALFYAINTAGNQTVDILNNTIGSTSVANSLVMSKSSTTTGGYYMIRPDNAGASVSNISNNTFANLQFNHLIGASTSNFYGIFANAGSGGKVIDNNTFSQITATGGVSDIRFISTGVLSEITNNKVGSQSSTGDLVIESTREATFYGIRAEGDFASKITGNQIGGISKKATLATSGTGGIINYIYVAGSNTVATLKTVENNLVGGTVANSLQTIPGGGAGVAQIDVVGIVNIGAINRNNVIRNITANETGSVTGLITNVNPTGVVENNSIENLTVNGQTSSSYLCGIQIANVTANTIGNTISGLKNSNAVALAASQFKHVMGIFSAGSGIVSGNKISNLEATGAGATSVFGIVAYRTSILKNRIYDLKSSNSIAGSSIGGMALLTSTGHSGSFTLSNNVINVNYSGSAFTYGIFTELLVAFDPALTINASYNTILLEGTASGSAISSAIYRNNNSPLDLKNNLLFNNRSGGSGIHSLYGTTNTSAAWVSDYNFLATAAGNTNVGNWNSTAQNFAAWKAGHSGQDINSVNDMSLTPSAFFNMASASTDFLRTTASGKLKVGNLATPNSVTDDIIGTSRAATPTIGAFEEVVVLPVTFNGFTAKLNGNKVNLGWNVSSEVDIIRYEVERLTKGTDFVKVATVSAGQLNGYSAVDANPQLGSNYYRLLAINSDGTASYFTEVREVKVASLVEATAVVYPNPLVGNTINVTMAPYSAGTYQYKISDITGKLLQSGSFDHKGGGNTITISAAMPKGVYVLQISKGKEQIQAKLIKP